MPGPSLVSRFRKLIGAVLGSVSATGVVLVLASVGVVVDPVTAGAIATVAAWLGTAVAPANEAAPKS